MTFLPIVARELRVASRRRGTYRTRVASAVVGLLVGAWILLVTMQSAPQMTGKILFTTISVLIFVYSIGGGARLTADCLSEEKREGTLGLLFLTDLKGYDVVLGKLAASSLNAFYSMLAIFPVLAISLLLGGVTAGEFWRAVLTAVNLIFFSLGVGMFGSSICRDERKALSASLLIVILLCLATPLAGLYEESRTNIYPTLLLLPSPAYGCFLANDTLYRFSPGHFWQNVAITHIYGWLFLLLACAIVPRSWQDKPSHKKPGRLTDKTKRLLEGPVDDRKAYRTRLLSINPFYWLAARARFKPQAVWVFLIVSAALWFWGFFKVGPSDWLNIGNYLFTAIVVHTIIKTWFASEACRVFVEDRKSGAMELLLSTPLSVEEILRGQRLALARQFLGPVIAVVMIDIVFLLLGLRSEDIRNGLGLWLAVAVAGISIFVMDLYALTWAGIWAGMTHPQINRAASVAVLRIMFLPWLAFVLVCTGIAIIDMVASTNSNSNSILNEYFYAVLWFGLSFVNNLIFTLTARRQLQQRFREIVNQRYAPRPSRSIWRLFAKKTSAAETPSALAQ